MRKVLLTGLAVLGLAFASCEREDGVSQADVDQVSANAAQQAAQLQAQIDAANTLIAGYQSEIEALNNENAQLLSNVSDQAALITSLTGQIQDLNTVVSDLEAQAAALAGTIEEQSEVISNLENTIAEANELNADLNEIIADLRNQIDELIAAAQADGVQINDLFNQIAGLEADLATAQDNSADEATIAALEADIAELKAQLAVANGTVTALVKSIREGFLFLYAPSLDTDGDGYSNILTSTGEDTGFDLNDEGLTDAALIDSFKGFAAKFGA